MGGPSLGICMEIPVYGRHDPIGSQVRAGAPPAATRGSRKGSSLSVFLPALNHLIVFFLPDLGIHRKEWLRAILKFVLFKG